MNSSGSTQLIGALSSLESNSCQFQLVFHLCSSCCVSANPDKFRKELAAREINWHFGNCFIEQGSKSWIRIIITANREQHLREDTVCRLWQLCKGQWQSFWRRGESQWAGQETWQVEEAVGVTWTAICQCYKYYPTPCSCNQGHDRELPR